MFSAVNVPRGFNGLRFFFYCLLITESVTSWFQVFLLLSYVLPVSRPLITCFFFLSPLFWHIVLLTGTLTETYLTFGGAEFFRARIGVAPM